MKHQSDPHPYLVQLRKQAKELKKSRRFAKLSEAQFELAKSLGHASWPKLLTAVQLRDLHRSIVDGDKDLFRAILDQTPKLATMEFEDGSTPVLTAAEYDDPDMISALYAVGGSLQKRYANSAHTPLSWALTTWSYHAAIRLVELGEKPDLFCAAGLGSVELLKQFWKDGELIKNASHTGSSRYDAEGNRLPRPSSDPAEQISDALYLACRCGRYDAAKFLLEQGADPNYVGYAGATCLHWAEFANVDGLADLLRSYGGDDTLIDPNFLATPRVFGLFVLIGWRLPNWRLRVRLKTDPSLANARGGHGTALHVAIFNNNTEAISALLEYGADRTALNAYGSTPYQQAIALGRPELADMVK